MRYEVEEDYTVGYDENDKERERFITQDSSILAPEILLTYVQFLKLFTQPEREAIYTAAKTAVSVQILLDFAKGAQGISRHDPVTIDGLEELETAGMIGPGRAAAILAA